MNAARMRSLGLLALLALAAGLLTARPPAAVLAHPATDATLTGLTVTVGGAAQTLAPAFTSSVRYYTVPVADTVTRITIEGVPDGDATVAYENADGTSATDADSGTAGMQVDIPTAGKRLNVVVTHGADTRTYGVLVIREGPAATDTIALMALYNSTGGDNWPLTRRTNWGSAQPLHTWIDITGYRLSADFQLRKNRSELVGTLPPELGNLTNANELYFNRNMLSGSIPDLSRLTKLRALYLHTNTFSGPIPAWLENVTSLKELELSRNQFSGTIPAWLGNLTNLTRLVLYSNQFSGTIPASLGNLTNLTDLRLSYNEFTGEIPDLDSLTNLQILYLNRNQLTGSIPAWLGDLTALQRLSVHTNLLTGSIPTELGKLTSLQSLYLSGNQFTGCLPNGLRRVPTNDFARVGLPFCSLSALSFSNGVTLDQAFDTSTDAYTASARASASDTVVAVTLHNPGDTVSITKGTDSYTLGDLVPLDVGENVITISVSTTGGTPPHTYAVTVTRQANLNPNSQPEFPSSEDGARSVDENTPANTNIGAAIAAVDANSDRLTYSISGADAAVFDVVTSSGQLRTSGALDYESGTTSYSFTMSVHDGKDIYSDPDPTIDDVITVTVTVEPVNEPPMVMRSSGSGAFSIEENSGTTVGSFDADDPEGDDVTWSLATTGNFGRFEIDETSGELSFKESEFNENEIPDYESSDLGIGLVRAYNVTVRATEADDADPQTSELTGSLAVTVRVTDVNEPPVITGNQTPSVAENTTAVGTYSATDPEGVAVTWSLQTGADLFTISSGGVLAFKNTHLPNYEVETEHTAILRASDGTNTIDHPVTVTVTDVDEPEKLLLSARRPLIGADYTASFEQGTGDDVPSPTWAWGRSTSSTSGFSPISGETAATYIPVTGDSDSYLRVTASYNDGHSNKTLQATSQFVTAATVGSNLAPTFEPPLFPGGATGLSVRENATGGTVVGTAPQAMDPESRPLSYSLAVTGFTTDPPFVINASSRQIRVAAGAALDHEDRETFSVTVTAEDDFNATGNGHVRHHHRGRQRTARGGPRLLDADR